MSIQSLYNFHKNKKESNCRHSLYVFLKISLCNYQPDSHSHNMGLMQVS